MVKLRGIGIVGEQALMLVLFIVIGLLLIDIVLQVVCCIYSGRGSVEQRQGIRLAGSGSTFIYPQMQEWIKDFERMYPDILVTYNPTGSGTGQAQLLREKVVDFACSDPPLTKEQYQQYKGEILQMPIIVGAIAIVYKIPGYDGPLNLTGEVIAKIYRGSIKYWDDDAIKSLNPKANLPHAEIKVIHRSDSSGTTAVFTFFLHKAAPDVWPSSLVGKAIEWPVDATGRGLGAKGNQGVAEYFKELDSAIAYVELGYALENNFSIAAVMNREGVFVEPTVKSMQAAISSAIKAGLLPRSPLADWSGALDAIVYAPGKDSYPLVSFTFMIVWAEYPAQKAEAIKKFIEYINTVGQHQIVEGYAPIPTELQEINLKALDIIRGR
ncbi:phosphate ABC transporter substrate-binding protein PstS [Pyrofollis japonicus]|uniref:phosphate ABC transporter substrate-binding protein PstS n=1 Tax=Pyrofollis japonicus TaxID=3060460 RepID=UPI00295AB5FF|nr:phosphate ABC transporter substrate-binding protein PstS [Pyrofollis japonicus]BEP17183.1 phosphate ABC transporter substrate-binding protein PstS [Pyrofollis japonicus]